MKVRNRFWKYGSGLAIAAMAANTASAAIDVTDATTELTTAGTAIGTVGAAILVLAGISLAYRWVKAQFF